LDLNTQLSDTHTDAMTKATPSAEERRPFKSFLDDVDILGSTDSRFAHSAQKTLK